MPYLVSDTYRFVFSLLTVKKQTTNYRKHVPSQSWSKFKFQINTDCQTRWMHSGKMTSLWNVEIQKMHFLSSIFSTLQTTKTLTDVINIIAQPYYKDQYISLEILYIIIGRIFRVFQMTCKGQQISRAGVPKLFPSEGQN